MKSAVPLYEFMPYGAPELLEAHRAFLSRALVLTSLLALATFATVGAVLPRLPRRALHPVEIPVPFQPHDFTPPPLVYDPAARLVPTARVASHVSGVPIPVPEPRDLPSTTLSTGGAGIPGAGAQPAPADLCNCPGPDPITAIDPDQPVTVVEEVPEAIRRVEPAYPDMASQVDAEGLVVVLVLVGRDGRVREARLDPNRHVLLLDAAALDAARQWVFRPAQVNGHPVATWSSIPFRFRIH